MLIRSFFKFIANRQFFQRFASFWRSGELGSPSVRYYSYIKAIRSFDYNQAYKQLQNNIFHWDTSKHSARIRILIVMCFFGLCFASISYRLLLVTSKGYQYVNNYNGKHKLFRKEIVDRNGSLLAVNVPSASLFANPRKVINPEEDVQKLKAIMPELNAEKLLAELKSDRSFIWIKRDISPKEQSEIFNLGLPGFDFENEQKRVYIFGNLLSHLLGYVGRDLVGLSGIEKAYDDSLTNRVPVNPKEDVNAPLKLSIDVRLQNILNEEIEKKIEEFRPRGAVGIIADPKTGEILAMVSKPDFNPNHYKSASTEQLFNMASLGIYEMGSVFKALTIAIGFDTNAVSINDAYDLSYMKVGNFAVKDYHPMKGWHSVAEIFMHSSNIGVSQIMLEVGGQNFKSYLKALGLLDQLKIELPERGTPLFPSSNRWKDISLVTMSYGYGLSVSPLHFVQAIIPVVNGGTLYPLTLIKKDQNTPLVGEKVFEEKTSKQMNKLFRLVVREGSGRRANVPGYLVGGKTGTANKAVGGKYSKNTRISSFISAFPLSDPKYVIYIMFDEPKPTKETFGFATAGWTAAPAVGRVIERIATLYGIETIDETAPEIENLLYVDYKIDKEV